VHFTSDSATRLELRLEDLFTIQWNSLTHFTSRDEKYVLKQSPYGSGSQSMGQDPNMVAKGRRMGCAKVIEICQNKLFSVHFSTSFNSLKD